MLFFNEKEVKFKVFPNNEVTIEDSEDFFTGKSFKIQLKFESNEDLLRLYVLKSHIESRPEMRSLNSVLEVFYMPYSRMDRVEGDSVFTLKYIANFINSMKFSRVEIHEAHSDVSLALIDNSVNISTSLTLLDDVLEQEKFTEDDYIMFPDAGASKRYHDIKGNLLVGIKNRDFATGEIKSLDLHGDFNLKGTKAVIVDDLSSYGGTFVRSAKALRDKGIKEVYLVVTHAENAIFLGELFDHIDKVYTTNSILSEEKYWHNVKYQHQLNIKKLYTKGENK